jgi:hypothetical protein
VDPGGDDVAPAALAVERAAEVPVDADQHVVAGGVPEAVVDGLEVVVLAIGEASSQPRAVPSH